MTSFYAAMAKKYGPYSQQLNYRRYQVMTFWNAWKDELYIFTWMSGKK